jgi:hypothetical protein
MHSSASTAVALPFPSNLPVTLSSKCWKAVQAAQQRRTRQPPMRMRKRCPADVCRQREQCQCGGLMRISDVHQAADTLLYPLTHPKGDGGFAHHMLPHFVRRGGEGTALDPDGLRSGQQLPNVSPQQQQVRLQRGMTMLRGMDLAQRKRLKFTTLNEFYRNRFSGKRCPMKSCCVRRSIVHIPLGSVPFHWLRVGHPWFPGSGQ